jgi:4-amino-4-deoxy-L-arabinose transferase-like glycosyltransferase
VRELVRKHSRFFLVALAAGVALRLVFLLFVPAVVDDSKIYADIAKNWLQHGVYGVTDGSDVTPTLARLPGYPAFLALIFATFGVDHFRAVLVVQMVIDIGTCFLIADMARRTVSEKAALWAFGLSALCPFFANYSAAALTETLEIFFTAAALDCAIAGLDRLEAGAMVPWAGCGAAVGACILLRPDGGILLAAIGAYLGWLWLQRLRQKQAAMPVLKAGLLVAGLAVASLVPWTLRNFHTLHRFQPLAPRYANEEDEAVPLGFNRWVKTWMGEYVSVQEIYWNIPGETVDPTKLPTRAFDSYEQHQQSVDLLASYNDALHITPEMDGEFAAIAAERIRAHPLRYYLRLPVLRIADMWLRPRTELLPPDPRWWEFNDDPKMSTVAVAFGLINLFYMLLAVAGLVRGRIAWLGLLLTFVLLRSAFLGSLENPEPRYTLECFPALFVLAAACWRDRVVGD